MSYIVKAGTPYLRYTDPMIPQVNPRGLQPQSSYIAKLAYGTGQTDSYATQLTAPPDVLTTEILLFGCDYPQRWTMTQYYGETFLLDGTATNIDRLTFAVPSGPPFGSAGISILPFTLASQTPAAAKYQEKVTGETITEGVTLTGFPFFTGLLGHNLWATETGDAGDHASYSVEVNMALDSGSTNGPAPFLEINGETVLSRLPVILWEPDFTQQIVDDGFKVNGVVNFDGSGTPFVLDVVGIWAGYYLDGDEVVPYSPLPTMTQARAKLAAPADGAAPAAHPYAQLLAALKKKV
jgi:hypothetical protein